MEKDMSLFVQQQHPLDIAPFSCHLAHRLWVWPKRALFDLQLQGQKEVRERKGEFYRFALPAFEVEARWAPPEQWMFIRAYLLITKQTKEKSIGVTVREKVRQRTKG